MVAIVGLTVARSLGFDLDEAVRIFRQQVEDHASTVDVPAPTAHPLVEQIVKFHDGQFVIEDDVPASSKRSSLAATVESDQQSRLAAICSPARRTLAQMDRAEIMSKPEDDRTQAERDRLAQIALVDARSRAVQRHAALLQIEIEDLPDAQLEGWQPHSWP